MKKSPILDVTLDEVIVIPPWDPNILSYKQIETLQELLKRKKRKEEMKRDQKKKQVNGR